MGLAPVRDLRSEQVKAFVPHRGLQHGHSASCPSGSRSGKGTAAEGIGGSGMPPGRGGGSPRRPGGSAFSISPPPVRTRRGQRAGGKVGRDRRAGRGARQGRRAGGRTRLPRSSPSLLVTHGSHPNIPGAMCQPLLVQVLLTSCGGTFRGLSSRAHLPKRPLGLRHPSSPSHAVAHFRVDTPLTEES